MCRKAQRILIPHCVGEEALNWITSNVYRSKDNFPLRSYKAQKMKFLCPYDCRENAIITAIMK